MSTNQVRTLGSEEALASVPPQFSLGGRATQTSVPLQGFLRS